MDTKATKKAYLFQKKVRPLQKLLHCDHLLFANRCCQFLQMLSGASDRENEKELFHYSCKLHINSVHVSSLLHYIDMKMLKALTKVRKVLHRFFRLSFHLLHVQILQSAN